MFLVGLTGGISTGKTTVSQMLTQLGCHIIDADLIARQVVEPGTTGWKKIREVFGEEVFHQDGYLNREKLGNIIFADSEKRKKLNSIVHPEIYKAMVWKILRMFLRGEQFVVLDLPLLFESRKMVPFMAYTVVVSCSQDQQLGRLMIRNNLTEEEALQRINSQMPLEDKCYLATHVIDNSGELEDTNKQVDLLYEELRACRRHWLLRFGLLSVVASVGTVVYLFLR